VRQAFEQYELRAERDHLARELGEVNTQLAQANAGLARTIATQGHELALHHRMLELSREVLEHLPVGVLGVGDDGLIAVANGRAHLLLGQAMGTLLGKDRNSLPEPLQALCRHAPDAPPAIADMKIRLTADSVPLRVHCERLEGATVAAGNVLVLGAGRRAGVMRVEEQALEQVSVGARVALDVMDARGDLLLGAGSVISERALQQLARRGVTALPVMVEETLTAAQRAALAAQLQAQFSSVRGQPLMEELLQLMQRYRGLSS